jgi:hypothetical protein
VFQQLYARFGPRGTIALFARDSHGVTFFNFGKFHDPDSTEPLLSTSTSMYALKDGAPLNTRLRL